MSDSIEAVRSYWDAQPCNIKHSDKPFGTKAYFDEVELRKYTVEPHILRFADFPRWRGKRVLEIGCGIGTDTICFARNGAKVWAVDLSRDSLEIVKWRASVMWRDIPASGGVVAWCDNAEHLNLLGLERFDLVYSFGVLHHTPEPERALRAAVAHLKPGGTVKVMLYHRWSWKALGMLFGKSAEAQIGCPVVRTYTKHGAQRLLESAGLTLVDSFVDHIFPYRVADYREYRYVKLALFRWMPARMFRWLETHFGAHLCLTAVKRG
jgi:2-polyprenyl-3-methyl-5-hydroxy-6-metoxy-1,4-benzoquinol methylase